MARRHTGGWELLGLDADPTPGDTEAIRAVASAYGGVAEQAERADLLLRGARINDGAGDAMRELNARVGELPDKLRRTSESFHRVAVAYDRYAGTLETAQGRLDQAIDQAEAVHATASLDLPDRPAAGAGAAETGEFERQTGRIEAAREQLGAAERLAADARALREDGSGAGWGSRQVERELDDAAAAAIPERDLWDRTVDLFDDAGEAIDEFFTQHPWVETVLQIAVGPCGIRAPTSSDSTTDRGASSAPLRLRRTCAVQPDRPVESASASPATTNAQPAPARPRARAVRSGLLGPQPPGRAHVHLGDSRFVTVQVPEADNG